MIRLTCTNCKNVLEMDDAFAGGACRCIHCRTIQTVPKHLKGNGGPGPAPGAGPSATAVSDLGSSMTLFQAAAGRASSGVESLADVAASSGLSRAGLRRTPEALPPPEAGGSSSYAARRKPATKGGNFGVLVGVLGGIILLLAGVIVFLVTRGGGSKPVVTANNPATPAPAVRSPAAAAKAKAKEDDDARLERERRSAVADFERRLAAAAQDKPSAAPAPSVNGGNSKPKPAASNAPKAGAGASFDIKLDDALVLYVVDRGPMMGGGLNPAKQALVRSLKSLKPTQRFQVMFSNGGGDTILPAGTPAEATPERIASVEKALAGVTTQRQPGLGTALNAALAQKPGAVVMIGGTGYPNDFISRALAGRGGAATRIHCVSVGRPEPEPVLKQIAEKSGGQYRNVTKD